MNMTRGPIMRAIILFAVPMVLGNILKQLYSTVDTLIIGNFSGAVSIAAVGTSSQPLEIFMCIFMGIGSGVSILVSMYTGAGDREELDKTVHTSVTVNWLFSVPFALLGILLAPSILRLMQVPEDTMEKAAGYLRIVFLGLPGNMGYNMNAGILRGLGNSRASLLFLVVSCLVNTALDLLFVAVLGMDTRGAALATTLSMYLSWVVSIRYIRKNHPDMHFEILPRALPRDTFSRVLRIGLPLGMNNSIYTVGHILLQSLINTQGSHFMAGCSVAGKIMGISSIAISSFAAAMSTFAGQNYGAKNYSRLRRGARIIPVWSGLITLALGSVVLFFAGSIIRLFTGDEKAMEYALLCIRLQMPFQWCFCVLNMILNLSNGIGAVKYSTAINLLMLWAVRIPCAYLIANLIDGHYVTASVSVSFVFGMLASLLFFRSARWKEIRAIAAQQEAEGPSPA